MGWAAGQAAAGEDSDAASYLFAKEGLTHGDLSLRLTTLPFSAVGLSVSANVEGHFTRAWDRETPARVASTWSTSAV